MSDSNHAQLFVPFSYWSNEKKKRFSSELFKLNIKKSKREINEIR